MNIDVSPSGALIDSCDLIAVGIASDTPTVVPKSLDKAFKGALSIMLADDEFKAAAGTKASVRVLGQLPAKHVLLVGTGSGSPADLRLAAGAVGHFAREQGASSVRLQLAGGAAHTQAAVEGVVAGNYRYTKYKTAPDAVKAPIESLTLLGLDGDKSAVDAGRAVGAARNLARDLVNAPADEIYPETLAAVATGLATGRLTVEVWDDDKIRSEGMGGISAVGQGSDRKPRFVHMTYEPAGKPTAEVALVGKGVTFDAGGLSIKPTAGMMTMRCDMGGAAAVVGTMSGLEALGIKARVHGIFGAAENMVSGNSYKLGDILKMYSGKRVEIHNTDAEGRLVLADCLHYASQLPATHIVDLATLTGAAVVALGEHYTAVYANDEAFSTQLVAASKEAGEGFWPMPLEPLYDEQLKAEWGDIKNLGSRYGGSITAGLFLQNFVAEGKTWSHLDIAGPAFLSKPEHHLVTGGTGAGVVTLLRWLSSL